MISFIEKDGTIVEKDIEVTYDSSLQGYLDESYHILVKAFGTPGEGDAYKTDAEWEFMSDEGHISIYNYKDGKNYNGADGTPTEKIRDWHIGGMNKKAVELVMLALQKNLAAAQPETPNLVSCGGCDADLLQNLTLVETGCRNYLHYKYNKETKRFDNVGGDTGQDPQEKFYECSNCSQELTPEQQEYFEEKLI